MKNRSPKEIVDYNLNVYQAHLVKDGKLDEYQLRVLCENIEREARGAAVRTAFCAANAINNGIDIDSELSRLNMLDHQAAEAAKAEQEPA